MITHRMGKIVGVMALAILANSAAYAHTVTASVLNVRSGPGFGYRVIGTVTKGTIVNVVARSGAWSKINSPKTGWCYSSYLADRSHSTTSTSSGGSSSSSFTAAAWKTAKAPPADYRIIYFRGKRVNVRTQVMVYRTEAIMRTMGLRSSLYITQGSYNSSVSASAGTHDGGGALDISIRGYSTYNADQIVKAMRMAGFAAWRRGVNDSFAPHIHAIAIKDARASSGARYQVYEYFRSGDGLVGSRRDIHLTSVGHNIGRPVPNWAQ